MTSRRFFLFEITCLEGNLSVPRAIEVTAAALLPWVTAYQARLIAPAKGVATPERRGTLPATPAEARALLRELVGWLEAHSAAGTLYTLRLFEPGAEQPTFDFPDVPHDWSLWLTDEQWRAVQGALRAAGLPADLFYPAEAAICVPWPGQRWRDRLLRRLGFQRCFTPRQWRGKN